MTNKLALSTIGEFLASRGYDVPGDLGLLLDMRFIDDLNVDSLEVMSLLGVIEDEASVRYPQELSLPTTVRELIELSVPLN